MKLRRLLRVLGIAAALLLLTFESWSPVARGSSALTDYPNTCRAGQYVGNTRSHVLHAPGDRNLPAPYHQVCFSSEAAGKAAGYRLSRSYESSGHVGSLPRYSDHGQQPSATTVHIPHRPTPREEVFHGCPGMGRPHYDPDLNLLKNRIDRATHPRPMSLKRFIHLPWPHAVSSSLIAMPYWTHSERRQAYRYEGMAVSLTGYITDTRLEETESTNCEGKGGYDWHVWIGPVPGSSRARSVITEATPRVRARERGFDLGVIESYAGRAVKVRITGWTLLDYEHPEQLGSDRATLWELHPITKIDLRVNGHWHRLAG